MAAKTKKQAKPINETKPPQITANSTKGENQATDPNKMYRYQKLHLSITAVGTVAALIFGYWQVRINIEQKALSAGQYELGKEQQTISAGQYEINKNLLELNSRPSVFIKCSQNNDGLYINNTGFQDLSLYGMLFPNKERREYISNSRKPPLIPPNTGFIVQIEGFKSIIDWCSAEGRANHDFDLNCYFKTANGQKWVAQCAISSRLIEQKPLFCCSLVSFQKQDWNEIDLLNDASRGK